MNTYSVQRSRSFISEETFEITIENLSCCDWCTVPNSQFLCSLPSSQVLTGNDSTCIKRGILGDFRPCPLKIEMSVDEYILCQS